MTTATVIIDLPTGIRVAEFESQLAALAIRYGTTVARSSDPRWPCRYELRRRYASQPMAQMESSHEA